MEMSTILDSLFHKVDNTTSTPIGMEGVMMDSYKVGGSSDSIFMPK